MDNNHVIIIGAGLAGSCLALELAKTHKVLLIEQGAEAIPKSSTSYNQTFRLHSGMHYLKDVKTALLCLEKAIIFAHQLPETLVDSNSPMAKGRYYILNDSVASIKECEKTINAIKTAYFNHCQANPDGLTFGKCETFINELNEKDYNFISSKIPYTSANGERKHTYVKKAFEVQEPLVDINKLARKLRRQIADNENIKLFNNTQVKTIHPSEQVLGYHVYTNNLNTPIKASAVVNCSWQNIEKLDKDSGHFYPMQKTVNRIKASLIIKPTKKLQDKKLNPSLFAVGPFFSLAPLPDGTILLTSETPTNIGFYESGERIPDQYENMLEQYDITTKKGLKVANDILTDCANCFTSGIKTELLKSDMLELRLGIVKVKNAENHYSQKSLYETDSGIHNRLDLGIDHKQPGYVSFPGMKMTYIPFCANLVKTIINNDMEHFDIITKALPIIKKHINNTFLKNHKGMVNHLIRNAFFNDIVLASKNNLKDKEYKKIAQAITNCIVLKLSTNQLIKQHMLQQKKAGKSRPSTQKSSLSEEKRTKNHAK